MLKRIVVVLALAALATGCTTEHAAHSGTGSATGSVSKVPVVYGTGNLQIRTSVDGAELAVDGAPWGNVMNGQGFAIPAGYHDISISSPGYAPFVTKIYITHNNGHLLMANLKPLPGAEAAKLRAASVIGTSSPQRISAIRISVDVPSEVHIDGHYYGDIAGGEGERSFQLPVGEHKVVLKSKGYKDYSIKVDTAEGISPILLVKMEPCPLAAQ